MASGMLREVNHRECFSYRHRHERRLYACDRTTNGSARIRFWEGINRTEAVAHDAVRFGAQPGHDDLAQRYLPHADQRNENRALRDRPIAAQRRAPEHRSDRSGALDPDVRAVQWNLKQPVQLL